MNDVDRVCPSPIRFVQLTSDQIFLTIPGVRSREHAVVIVFQKSYLPQAFPTQLLQDFFGFLETILGGELRYLSAVTLVAIAFHVLDMNFRWRMSSRSGLQWRGKKCHICQAFRTLPRKEQTTDSLSARQSLNGG